MDLPRFKYHPAPLNTGSIVASERVCQVCEKARGFAYQGVPYGGDDLETVCPWCIADGSAHEKFRLEFTDRDGIGGGEWESIPREIADEVAFRTPGFSGWQQERWFTHCGDAAEFLGPMGKDQIEQLDREAVEVVRVESGYEAKEWAHYYNSLNLRTGPATAYLFRWRHCGKLGGYSDSQ
jgi:uncharacterized protein